MPLLARLVALLVLAAAPTLVAPGPAGAAAETWSPLQRAGGSALAVAVDGRRTALVSVGGPDDATVYDQRRSEDGTLGPRTEVVAVDGVEDCRPVEAASANGSFAVAVECRVRTGLEEPPTRLAELVWTGDDRWVWHVQPEGELASIDWSPGGQYVAFTSNSRYGRPHHVTSYHADLGWRDLTRRQRGISEELVAAISDNGNVVALRGAGTEDEPGYWFGGRLRIDGYGEASGEWTRLFARGYPDGGIRPTGIDLVAGRITAAVVRSRSTGRLNGQDEKLVVLSGAPKAPRSWSTTSWKRRVLAATAARTAAGVGVAAWQVVGKGRTAGAWFATWPAGRADPIVRTLRWRTTLTDAAEAGRALDMAVGADGHGVIAYVRHRRGADRSAVAGASFRVGPRGGVRRPVDVTWKRPVQTTVSVVAGAGSSTVTLGRMVGPFFPSSTTHVSVGP